MHVVDDADDGVPLRRVARADPHAAAERVPAGEVLLLERAVDDHRERPVHVVARGERASLAQREAHRLEVARRHDLPVARRALSSAAACSLES